MLQAVLNAGLVWLAAVGVLFAVIGAYYYLRVVWYMYFAEPVDTTPLSAAADVRIVMSANALGLLVLGVFPGGCSIFARACSASDASPCGAGARLCMMPASYRCGVEQPGSSSGS